MVFIAVIDIWLRVVKRANSSLSPSQLGCSSSLASQARASMIARTGTEQLRKCYFQERVALIPTLMRGCEGWVLTNAPGPFF